MPNKINDDVDYNVDELAQQVIAINPKEEGSGKGVEERKRKIIRQK